MQSASNSADREAAVATTNGKDAEEDQMEKAVVAFLRKLRGPAHLGQDIGPFIIQKFGESRKVRRPGCVCAQHVLTSRQLALVSQPDCQRLM